MMPLMANLFWRTSTATTSLLATPFRTEAEFEQLIFQTPEILADILLLKRQIRGGGKQGISVHNGMSPFRGDSCLVDSPND